MKRLRYRLKEVAEMLGITQKTVRNYVYEGRIKAYKSGGNFYVNAEDLDEFMFREYTSGRGMDPDKVKSYLEKEENDRIEKQLEDIMKKAGLR